MVPRVGFVILVGWLSTIWFEREGRVFFFFFSLLFGSYIEGRFKFLALIQNVQCYGVSVQRINLNHRAILLNIVKRRSSGMMII